MTAATAKATGTRGARYAASGRVRIAITVDEAVFDDLKAAALRNHRSIAEEVRRRFEVTTAKERAA
jgi:hypothetical protein